MSQTRILCENCGAPQCYCKCERKPSPSDTLPSVAFTALFDRCTETKRMKDGSIQIHCKLGLWSVCGIDHERVKAEARHYFGQYLGDGEYADLLSNPRADRMANEKGEKE